MIRRKMRLITVAGLVLMLTFVLAGGAVAAKPEVAGGLAGGLSEEYIADEILVKFKPGVGPDAQDAIHRAQGATVKGRIHQIGVLVLRIPAGQVLEKVAAYQRNPNVEYAEPNFIARAHLEPDDTYYSLQWHLDDQVEGGNPYGGENGGGINVEPAWDISTGEGVTVAVIDTGVAYENYTEAIPIGRSGKYRYVTYALAPDLADTNFVPGYDFVNDDAQPNDDEGHGTHVTGTIAQSTNNNLGVAGVAFDCSIMPVKVLDTAGSGTYSDIADGIYYAVGEGADIINLSLGGTAESITLENAVAYAYNNGVTVIASAGNSGPGGAPSYPAAYDAYVIAVGATRYDEAVAYYSTTGSYLDLTAPGGQLYIEGTTTMLDQNNDGYWDGVLQQTHDGSDYTNFGYWFYQGTSMAAPHVSGVAALLISKGVATTPDEVREALRSTAEDKGSVGWDEGYGWGIVDAYAALMYKAGPAPLTITTSTLPDGTVGVAYGATLEAIGGTTPYTWSIASGSLPDGLSLNSSTGVISGTPTTAGTSTFTIKVTDSATLAQETTKQLSITVKVVAPALSVTVLTEASYTIGDTVSITVVVTDAAGAAVSDSPVYVEVITDRGDVRYTVDGITDVEGKAYFEEYTIANRDGTGTYTVTADASHPDYESGSGFTTFEVTR